MSSVDPVFAIGDIQGCFASLLKLIHRLPPKAHLVFLGDIVNRGPQSLDTLRYLYQHRDRVTLLLGNHDLHLLACVADPSKIHHKDTIAPILEAPDAPLLIDWLRHGSLLYEHNSITYVHAGIPPSWSITQARNLAREAETFLRSDDWKIHLKEMYGNNQWDNALRGSARLQAILNGFTRLRFVDALGQLDFQQKETIESAPVGLMPWFDFPERQTKNEKICFGHWSMLGLIIRENLFAIDTGCLWGGKLTAIGFPSKQVIQEDCPMWADPFAFKKKTN